MWSFDQQPASASTASGRSARPRATSSSPQPVKTRRRQLAAATEHRPPRRRDTRFEADAGRLGSQIRDQFHRQFAAGPGAANGVALQSDSAIVAAGGILDQQEGDGEFALLRLTAGGVPDASFGSDGEVTTEFAGGDAEAEAVTVLPDGSIVAVGELDTAPGVSEFAIARYDVDGTLLWQTTTQFADGASRAADVVIEPDRIVAIGTVVTLSGSARFALAGYALAGDLDPTFGNGGTQDTAFVGGDALGRGAVLASTGEILVAGDFTPTTGNIRFALARYTADGSTSPSRPRAGRRRRSGRATPSGPT
jgi:uncharacterized delta-60 repeat protein